MPTYLSLVNFTQQGIQNIKESPARLDAAKKAFKAMGSELKHFYLTLGRSDIWGASLEQMSRPAGRRIAIPGVAGGVQNAL